MWGPEWISKWVENLYWLSFISLVVLVPCGVVGVIFSMYFLQKFTFRSVAKYHLYLFVACFRVLLYYYYSYI
ncbi:MAG: hypothetical protein DCC75_00235 [Proteobacteria bacterium]|nr:MAG: hypothetical protein DCC75_00235 [Pseudomonadota bacterium]